MATVCIKVDGMCISETYSEAVKILKGEYVVAAIEEHKMDVALIFCRTKLDCDNLENYLQEKGRGSSFDN
ncbi:ATP-dependent RNA helicase ddx1 [Bulinus truncatus]|nr:ATP-dependent RNA helicase ddx1 [Bulinus truncatus]